MIDRQTTAKAAPVARPAVSPFQPVPTPGERAGLTLMAAALGAALAGYSLLLLERKRKLLFGRAPFLVEQILGPWEKVFFVLFFCTEIILLVVTLSFILKQVLRRTVGTRSWSNKAAVLGVGLFCFAVVTAEFEVVQYFRDGLSLALIRNLSGNSSRGAIAYIQDEFGGLLDVVLGALVVLLVSGWLLRRYSHALSHALRRTWLVATFSSARGILAANAAWMVAPLVVVAISPELHQALSYGLAHRFYSLAAAEMTDMDRDGYGLLTRPLDFAPFDSSRHPYAVEVPGNSVDENGIGGDLPAVIWNRAAPAWDAGKLRRDNVLLLVVDSARSDLLDWSEGGRPVMPALRGAPGHRLTMISHAAYTIPSVIGMLNGTVSEREKSVSLLRRFRTLGYATGVFSGQHEGFGNIAAHTGMLEADQFIDATGFPSNQRMYQNASPGALSVPAPLVAAHFERWLGTIRARPFFAYLNFQEMHFPYYYQGAPRRLLEAPIPRARIAPNQREWVRRTYANAARLADEAFAEVMQALDRSGLRENTVILVLGDHGEELFEHGYLGHGTDLSYEQNSMAGKLIQAAWTPPAVPVGLSDVPTVIYNSLLTRSSEAAPLPTEVLAFAGTPARPEQLGMFSASGLLKYEFNKDRWLEQNGLGRHFRPAAPSRHMIHLWESFVASRLASPPGG
jgi:hypothetical protein